MEAGSEKLKVEKKERNRNIIKKLFKCTYYLVRKKWAVTANFEDSVKFVADLGVANLLFHIESPQLTCRQPVLQNLCN